MERYGRSARYTRRTLPRGARGWAVGPVATLKTRVSTMVAMVLALALATAAPAAAQEVPYRTGVWEADSLGNHRVVVEVDRPAVAVWAHVPWRRRDRNPRDKAVWVVTAAGERTANVARIAITREYGDLVFEAPTAGRYYLYYLPYTGTITSNYPKITYRPPRPTADSAWLRSVGLTRRAPAPRRDDFPQARVVALEAVSPFHSFYPMEVIATQAETRALLSRRPDPYLVFPEAREFPIRMKDDLPLRWIERGPAGVTGSPDRGEFFVFQLGVYAARQALGDVRVEFDSLALSGAPAIPAGAFRCFNQEGVDWQGHPFVTRIDVDSGRVAPLWCGVQIPRSAAPGPWRGTARVTAANAPTTRIPIRFEVGADTIRNAGDDDPRRLSRLRWLDSQLAADWDVVRPYTPVARAGDTVAVLGRRMAIDSTGMPRSIESMFTREMTAIGTDPRPILAAPVRLVVERDGGAAVRWRPEGPLEWRRLGPGAVAWNVVDASDPTGDGLLVMRLGAVAESDGHVAFTVELEARERVTLDDVRLELSLDPGVARYMMGMGRKGGRRPDSFDWHWDRTRNHDSAWLGDVNAGVQFSLRDERYRRPLNTNFYQRQPLVMPRSWDNGGRGGCRFRAGREAYRISCYSGPRTMEPGEVQRYDFILLVTPFKPLDTADQWRTRFVHAYLPLDSVAALGANTINVHHATAINPWINYPFLAPDTMRAYIDSAHERNMRVKIYYTVRELTIKAPELFALRSLGHEVFSPGEGGGYSWLQEHLDGDYIAAWHVPRIKDAAIINTGISRWHNFYVEGLRWLTENMHIDGLYIDDVAFDRSVMKRVRKVLDRNRPNPMIDLHSANQYNERDGFVNSANLYLEHFPYIDRLWFGEYFDYDAEPDYWLVEVSGIPFGLMGEMLQGGGNQYRGLLYGMTSRLPWSGDPRPIWRLWDDFHIEQSRMIGYWVPGNPVTTGRDDVLATVYVAAGRTMVAIASWAGDSASVNLAIDWQALEIDPEHATITAPPVRGFQDAASFEPGESIPVAPGEGWVLIIE